MAGEQQSSDASIPRGARNVGAPPLATEQPEPDYRWQALFRRASDAVFLLNHQRRILYVNRAWEELTGLKLLEARGLACVRRAPAAGDPWDLVVRSLCCPPAEVLAGKISRVRRPVPGGDAARRRWEIEFFPLFRSDEDAAESSAADTTPARILSHPTTEAVKESLALTTTPKERAGSRLLCILGRVCPVLLEEAVATAPLPAALVELREKCVQWHDVDQLPTDQPATRRLAEQIRLAAQVRAPVHILGEAGTGKEWTARTIHYAGPWRERAFMSLDCAGLPPRTLVLLLFGDDGPFAPAASLAENRAGISRNTTGAIYLRDPAALPRDLQLRLVPLLVQPPEFSPRILAGSSTRPETAIQAGRLLEEFCCALGTVVIEIPPLRDRQEDLPWLVERFLVRLGFTSTTLVDEVLALMRSHAWPGNLRELSSVLATAVARAQGRAIHVNHLPAYLGIRQVKGAEPARILALDKILEEVERRLIRMALQKTRGNKSRAAELLSIWRPRLVRRMEALGIGAAEETPEAELGEEGTPTSS